MRDFLEGVIELVRESEQFGKSRMLREYLDEIKRRADIELGVLDRIEADNGSDE